MNRLRAMRLMDQLYAELPTIACTGQCHDACGPVGLTELEAGRIEKRIGGRIPPYRLHCPLLHPRTKTCMVYGVRPLICRLWGVIEAMPCTYGCQPSRYLSDQEAWEFLARARELGGETVFIGSPATIGEVMQTAQNMMLGRTYNGKERPDALERPGTEGPGARATADDR